MSDDSVPNDNVLNDSILNDTKKVLHLPADYDAYDLDIMMHINSVFGILHQLGVGPSEVFSITGPNEKWDQFIQDKKQIVGVKSYIWAKVRLMFDPPMNAFTVTALEKICSEFEFRLNVAAEEAQNGN